MYQVAGWPKRARPGAHRTAAFFLRATTALVSQVVWWNGIWGVLDSHIWDNYWERNVLYIFLYFYMEYYIYSNYLNIITT